MRSSLVTLAIGVVLGASGAVAGLASAGAFEPSQPQSLVSLAQLVEAEHRRVDLLLEQGDVVGAIAALEQLRGLPWPSREQAGDEAVILRHDIYGRLLRLRLDHDEDVDPKTLLELANEGLTDDASAVDLNPFTARLVALRGECHEALDDDAAALTDYEKALEMNGTLLERELSATP